MNSTGNSGPQELKDNKLFPHYEGRGLWSTARTPAKKRETKREDDGIDTKRLAAVSRGL